MDESSASVHLDPTIKDDLEQEALLQHVSADDVAERAIKSYLEMQALKREAIRKAVVEADKGVFISSEAMSRWVDSWSDEGEDTEPPKSDIFPATGRA